MTKRKAQVRQILLMMVMAVLALTSCAAPAAGPSTGAGDAGSAATEPMVTEAGTFPIVEEPVTIEVLVTGDARIEDYSTNGFTQWYEEQTNVHVEWEVAPENEAQEKLNLVLASGDYPDVIMGFGIPPAQQMIYGSQGVFIPLNDLIEAYGVETKAMLEAYPEARAQITAPDGNIYALPIINQCLQCSMSKKMWIYQPWLDALGLELPTTTEEFHAVLKAFKEQDPNGNGQADEIPLAGATTGWNTNVVDFIMNAFIYTDDNRLMVRDGEIIAVFNQPEWREGLAYLNQLYADGLLAPQSFTQDQQQLQQLGENPDTVILGAFSAGHVGLGVQVGGPSGRWLEYTTVAPLEGPAGQRVAWFNPYQSVGPGQLVVTNAAEHPEVALRWADAMYDETIGRYAKSGLPGIHWDEAEEGMVGLDGRPATRVELIPYGQVQNDHWYQRGISISTDNERLSKAADPDTPNLAWILYSQTKEKYEPYQQDVDKIVPPLFFSREESRELADLQNTIETYLLEMTARFITGDADLEAEWDTYVQTLEEMGLPRYLEIYQTAYDARAVE